MKPRIVRSEVAEFLSHHRFAVVGVSTDPKKFGSIVFRELAQRGYDVVPVHRDAPTIEGMPSYPDLASVPDGLDGVFVMVPGQASVDVVRECIARGVPRVWLFKGLGGPGALTPEAVELCRASGVTVIAGACPLMFLEPVGVAHRVHRGMRRINRSLVATAA